MGETLQVPYIAVVDDDESVCRSLTRLLHASGMRSKSYRSAAAFLEDGCGERFDCLILDIQIDGMSGIELQERLAASGSTTPVIFITAHDGSDIRERAIRCGCIAYLTKSEPFDTVLAAIASAISRLHETRVAP
jgi:FixJ family two-component response regulator